MMKTLLNLLICLSLGLSTQAANNNPFKKTEERVKNKSEIKKSIPHYFTAKRSMNSVMVPTTEKNSWWDTMTNSWIQSTTTKYTYQDNRITESLVLSYDLNDTLGRTVITYDAVDTCLY